MLNNPNNNSAVDYSRVSDAELEEIINYGKEHGEPFIWDDQEFENCAAYLRSHTKNLTPESPPSEMKHKVLLMDFCTTRRSSFQGLASGLQKKIESMWCESISYLVLGIFLLGCTALLIFA